MPCRQKRARSSLLEVPAHDVSLLADKRFVDRPTVGRQDLRRDLFQTLPLRGLCRRHENGLEGDSAGHKNRKRLCDLALRIAQPGQRKTRQTGFRLHQSLREVEGRLERRIVRSSFMTSHLNSVFCLEIDNIWSRVSNVLKSVQKVIKLSLPFTIFEV